MFLLSALGIAAAQQPVVLVVTADAPDYVLAAGGTIAGMAATGAAVHLVRVTNDEKDSWKLSPEETIRRATEESLAAAKILGVRDVHALGYRGYDLGGVSFTEIRDRLIFLIRHYKPTVMFIPNPYTEFDRVVDRFYTGRAAEDAWRAAALENYQPPYADAGMRPHLTPELYYYAQPHDPYRREPESTATFVPQPKFVDIAAQLDRKIRAAQAFSTSNENMARRLAERLASTGRTLPLLATVNDGSIAKLVEENVRGLAAVNAKETPHRAAEEFRYAGVEFRIPRKYRSAR